MRKAVIDIGSNTIVLAVYNFEDGKLIREKYESHAVHLVQYIIHNHMHKEGMEAAVKVISAYKEKCKSWHVSEIRALMTEPWRGIDNLSELKETLGKTGIPITYLSGEDEAKCDFYGVSLDGSPEPLIIDIGGGSTEFISTEKGRLIDAVSIPLGCVRLGMLPMRPESSRNMLENMRDVHPKLKNAKTATGIGGTIRAVRDVCNALYHTENIIYTADLTHLYLQMQEEDREIMGIVKANVTSERQSVILAGMGMLVSAVDSFQIDEIHVSENGVREGFFMHYMMDAQSAKN